MTADLLNTRAATTFFFKEKFFSLLKEVSGSCANFFANKVFVGLFILFTSVSCSVGPSKFEGIWHTQVEAYPGFETVLEFKLKKEFFNNQWHGHWKIAEAMGEGSFDSVKVTGSNIELSFAPMWKFRGTFSDETRSFEGLFYLSDGTVDTASIIRANDWTTEFARIDETGEELKRWRYRTPELIDDGWPVATLGDAGISQKPFEGLFQSVIDGKYSGLDAVLVAYEGRLVVEEYFHLGERGRIHSLQSATKSVTSLLVGIAKDEGFIRNVDVPVRGFFRGFSDSISMGIPSSVTLKHALMMSAALDWNEHVSYLDPRNDAIGMNNSGDMYRYVLSRGLAAGELPGKKFYYNSGLSILLGGVLLNATGMRADKYAEKTLFKKLGIKDYQWISLKGQTHTGGGLFLRPRDVLKIGQLICGNGRWNGEPVISDSWIQESTGFLLSAKIVPGTRDWGYGYQWWREEFNVQGRVYPAIFAAGYGGQFLWIVPELHLVVLALHHNPADFKYTHSLNWVEMESIIIPAVLSNSAL